MKITPNNFTIFGIAGLISSSTAYFDNLFLHLALCNIQEKTAPVVFSCIAHNAKCIYAKILLKFKLLIVSLYYLGK